MKSKKELPRTILWIVVAVLILNQSVMSYQNYQEKKLLQNQIENLQEDILAMECRMGRVLEFVEKILILDMNKQER